MLKSLLSVALITLSALAQDKPNVLIFFIDDLGVNDIGINGSTFYETPHIDALARSGVNFTNAYSAHPVCSPTRASLMTGKAPQRVGITQWISGNRPFLALEEVTVAESLKDAGYRTGFIGKWHLGKSDQYQPEKQGFDHTVAVNRAGQPASFFYPFKSGKKPTNVPDLEDYQKGDYLTDALTDKSVAFIREESDKPFFLCLSHYAVHTPIQAPKALVGKYKQKQIEKHGDSEYEFDKGKYGKTNFRHQENPDYAAMMENLDMNIGRVMEAVKESGHLENTIVIFTSDNGGLVNKDYGPTTNAPFRSGKAWTYEGGVRIPTIISYPPKIKPAINETPIITMDFYPTLLDFCGLPLKPDQHLDGASLKKTIAGEEDASVDDRFLAWSYPHKHGNGHQPSNAIRKGDWKLIRFDNNEPAELYNIKDDIGESQNLAESNPDKVAELDALLSAWISETYAEGTYPKGKAKKKGKGQSK